MKKSKTILIGLNERDRLEYMLKLNERAIKKYNDPDGTFTNQEKKLKERLKNVSKK